MKKICYLAFDLACIAFTLLVALYLRHGFPLIQEGTLLDLILILTITLGTALIVLPIMRTHSTIWRFTSGSDIGDLMLAVALVILVSNTALFITNHLGMIPRSVPPMHWALAVCLMAGSRLLARRIIGSARGNHGHHVRQHVLVLGVGHTAEIYLQFARRILQQPIIVEGFLDSDATLTHRLFQKHKILGTPADLPRILQELRVHGIVVRQVVLTKILRDLPKEERRLLLMMKREGVIDLMHFAKYIGPQMEARASNSGDAYYETLAASAPQAYAPPKGLYPTIKRVLDITAGLILLLILSPLMLLVCLLVLLDVGFPLLFWQKRPGLKGKPFHLYKFRTMRMAGRKHDEARDSHKSADTQRMSSIGRTLRRFRLDELPQLFHILAGTMSFVGPRPLLPDDQPKGGEVRLSVRPGITGWAQVHGGDALTAHEKMVLDLWYIHHMSFLLDLRIALISLRVIVHADRRKLPPSAATSSSKEHMHL